MARWLSTLFLVLVLALAAILIVPSFVDWTQFRSLIEAQASRVTGRQVTIRGDIGLRLLPAPEMSLGDVSIADPVDSDAPLLSADRIEAVAAWGPLFKGEIEIRRLRLVEPIIRATLREDGKSNWRLARSPASAVGAGGRAFAPIPGAAGRFLFWSLDEVSFSDISVERGFLVFADERNGASEEISGISGRLAFERLTGPGSGDVLFQIAGQPLRLRYTVGAMGAGKTTPVSLILGFDAAPAELKIDGKATGLAELRKSWSLAPVGFDGAMELQAVRAGPFADGVRALAGFGGGRRIIDPVLPGTAANLPAEGRASLHLSAAPQGVWDVPDLSLTIGQSKWTGQLSHDWSSGACAGALASDLVYLDDFKPEPGAGGAAAGGSGLTLPGASGPLSALGQIRCTGGFTLKAENLLTDGIKLSDLTVKLAFAPGGNAIENASIQLPGAARLAIAGKLGKGGGEPVLLDGAVDFNSDEARQFFDWLDVDLGTVQPSKLQKIALASPLRLIDRAAVNAKGLRQQAAAPIVVPELENGRLTLDGETYTLSFAASPVAPSFLRFAFAGGAFDASAYGLAGALFPASPLDAAAWGETGLGRAGRFDVLDLDLDLAELGLGRTSAGGLKLSIDRAADGLALADVKIADLAGYTIAFDGARQVDRQSGQPLSKARLTVTGGANASFVLPFAEQPLARAMDLTATYDETPDTANWVLAGEMGDIAVSGAASGKPHGGLMADMDRLTLSAKMTEGELLVAGSLKNITAKPKFEGNLTVDALSFPAYMRALGYDYEPRKKDLGALSLVADLALSAEAVSVPRFAASVGQQTATGAGELSFTGERPLIDAGVSFGEVSINGFLPGPDGKAAWATDRFKYDFLTRADGQIRLVADRLELYAFDMKGVSADLKLKDGALSGQGMTASLYGGALSLSGSAAYRDEVLSLSGEGGLTRFDLAKAAPKLAGALDITGYGDVSFKAAAAGHSQFTLAQSLEGEADFKGDAGRLQGLDLATWSAGLDKVQSPESFLRLAKDTLSGGSSPFNSFSGRMIAGEGKIAPRGFFIDFDKAKGTLSGTVNAAAKTQNIGLTLELKDHPDLPLVKMIYTGAMKAPQRIYDLADLQKAMLKKFEASGAGRLSVKDLPPDLQEILKDAP